MIKDRSEKQIKKLVMDQIEQSLIDNYVLQKENLLARHSTSKRRPTLDRQRMAASFKPVAVKMAEIIRHWDVPAAVIMDAAFAYAKSMRHYDGPFPNMLGSASYLTKALAYRFEMPTQVIMERRAKNWLWEKMTERFQESEATCPPGRDLFTHTSVPALHRFIILLSRSDFDTARLLAPQVLEQIAADPITADWLAANHNLTYESIAKFFNNDDHAKH